MPENFDYMYDKLVFESGVNSRNDFGKWFENKLKYDFHDFYIIKFENQIIGSIYSYEFKLSDRHCKMKVLLDISDDKLVKNIIILFVELLFREYPLRKIFVEEYQKELIELYKNAGFQCEMILDKYIYCEGRYNDLTFLSIER